MIRNPAAPPLIQLRQVIYHAVTGMGGCACNPDVVLNLAHTTERERVPPGLRCQRPGCVAQWLEVGAP